MARISKVQPLTMNEDMTKRGDDRKKFVTAWKEVDGRTQRTTVVRTYAEPVHEKGAEMAKVATADFVDEEVTEYKNKF